jgi:hypothetical protein
MSAKSHKEKSISMLDVVCSKDYRVATWICFFIELLLAGSGIDAIMVYSTRLLENLKT